MAGEPFGCNHQFVPMVCIRLSLNVGPSLSAKKKEVTGNFTFLQEIQKITAITRLARRAGSSSRKGDVRQAVVKGRGAAKKGYGQEEFFCPTYLGLRLCSQTQYFSNNLY